MTSCGSGVLCRLVSWSAAEYSCWAWHQLRGCLVPLALWSARAWGAAGCPLPCSTPETVAGLPAVSGQRCAAGKLTARQWPLAAPKADSSPGWLADS